MKGKVVHFELPTDNTERARKFYSTTFEWKLMPMPNFEYTMVTTGDVTKEGMPSEVAVIGGGMAPRGGHVKVPVITIAVDEIDAALKLITKNGGAVLQKKEPIGDGSMGFTAYFKDTEGNTVGLYQAGKGMQ